MQPHDLDPPITVNRSRSCDRNDEEIGSRGMEVAAGVAARLGLKIIRSEIAADSVAERLGIEPSAFLRYMEGAASVVERWWINRRRLVHTAEEILRVAQQGNVLIKGWGAATLLRDLPQIISVRVCAPMEFRVRVLIRRDGTEQAGGERRVDASKSFRKTRQIEYPWDRS